MYSKTPRINVHKPDPCHDIKVYMPIASETSEHPNRTAERMVVFSTVSGVGNETVSFKPSAML